MENISEQKGGKVSAEEMIGKRYGDFEVVSCERVIKNGVSRWYAHVKCAFCGREQDRRAEAVRKITAGGCSKCAEKVVKYAEFKDLSGKIFNHLQVLHINGEYLGINKTTWVCKCLLCGKICSVKQHRLGVYYSCGCESKKGIELGHEAASALRVENTTISGISPDRKINKNSSTGITGVSVYKGKYRATIVFKRKQYDLGSYSTLEQAAAARKAAEKSIYGDFLERYYAGEFGEPYKKREKK